MRWAYKGYEIVQPPPPERQGLFCALVLGMLNHLDVVKLGHYTGSAETLYYAVCHAARNSGSACCGIRIPPGAARHPDVG